MHTRQVRQLIGPFHRACSTIAVAAFCAASVGFGGTTSRPPISSDHGIAVVVERRRQRDPGPATEVRFRNPKGVAVDAAGTVYIADTDHNRVWKVTTDGTATTVAGVGRRGFSGDGGPAIKAKLDGPEGLAVDGAGSLFVADRENGRVRRVGTDGTITTVAGTGHCCFSGDGGPAPKARLFRPTGLAVDSTGNLYIGDNVGSRIRRVGTDGTITTVAGTGDSGSSADGGSATQAPLTSPGGVAVDSTGTVYVADENDHRVRKVSPDGIIDTAAGINLSSDVLNNLPLPSGELSSDGIPGVLARLEGPTGVAVDTAGNLYIADASDSRVRRVSPEGTIGTVVGNSLPGSSGDGGPATQAQVDGPYALAFDAAGNLYIADEFAKRVRRISTEGTITTIAGRGR